MRFRLATCLALLSKAAGILQHSMGLLAPHSPVRKRSGSMLLGSDRERGGSYVKSYLSPEMIVRTTVETRGHRGRGDTGTRGRGDAETGDMVTIGTRGHRVWRAA